MAPRVQLNAAKGTNGICKYFIEKRFAADTQEMNLSSRALLNRYGTSLKVTQNEKKPLRDMIELG